MLEIFASSNEIITSGKVRIEASGGTAPYTFSLLSGGDGGSIQNGFYFAPRHNPKGFQKIRVTDSNGARKDLTIFILDQLQVVCSVIREYMGLQQDQVYVYNQKFIIPKDNRLYVSVGLQSSKIIGNNSVFKNGEESQYITVQAGLSINVMSKSLQAVMLKDDVIMALRSNASQRAQYKNGIRIFAIPTTINDVSGLDGALIPYRFNVSINIMYSIKNKESVDYYDDFERTLITNE